MDQFEMKKAALDKDLEGSSPDVGIALGLQLIEEFGNRGGSLWKICESPAQLCSQGRSPAYQRTHFVFRSWGIQDLDFKVGTNQMWVQQVALCLC